MLREDERLDMQRHTVIGEQETAKRGLNRAVQLLVRWHHEWWNGAGYPDALENTQIPLAARILRVADTFCAMTGERPHRASIAESEAKRYLIEWAGIEFDPKVVKAFLSLEFGKKREARPVEKVEILTHEDAEAPQNIEMPENIEIAGVVETTENIKTSDDIETLENLDRPVTVSNQS